MFPTMESGASSSNDDWRLACSEVKQRTSRLLTDGHWSDCQFLVGPEQTLVKAHKLLLIMSSPVFEPMLFGGLAEDTISVPDIESDTFIAMIKYLYTDEIPIKSFSKALDLYYAAQKYMLSHLIKICSSYMLRNLTPNNACRAYELASLFDDLAILNMSKEIMTRKTREILSAKSFKDIQFTTIVKIFSLERMEIDSELDLFNALERYVEANAIQLLKKSEPELESVVEKDDETKDDQNSHNSELADSTCGGDNVTQGPPTLSQYQNEQVLTVETLRSLLTRIRFLTLTPQQFAEGPALSQLLTKEDVLAIFMNLSSKTPSISMPDGFSTSREHRTMYLNWDHPTGHTTIEWRGVFQFTITSFRNRSQSVVSPNFYIENYLMAWRIKMVTYFDRREAQKYMGFFLVCSVKDKYAGFSCYTRAELCLISHECGSGDQRAMTYKKTIEHEFRNDSSDWGFRKFIRWEDAMADHYMHANSVTLEARIAPGIPRRRIGELAPNIDAGACSSLGPRVHINILDSPDSG